MRQDADRSTPSSDAASGPAADPARAERLSTLAKAPPARLAALWAVAGLAADWAWLRAPESGAVMLRGRAGGTGAAFNLGEMTATRCALRLATGEVGHGWTAGRDREKARLAALCDALAQTDAAEVVETAILAPLRAEAAARAEGRAARAAATKVEFFTLQRGDPA